MHPSRPTLFPALFYEVIHDLWETANKCTITPAIQAGRVDFREIRVKGNPTFGPLQSTVLLHHDGQCLSELRNELTLSQVRGIAAIDCVWPRLPGLLKRIEAPLPLLAKIPPGIQTAYPRGSRLDFNPEEGLATIEAFFVAAALLGRWEPQLLSEYYFGQKFIEMNQSRFLELGLAEAKDPACWPVYQGRPKNSKQRRLDRGRQFSV